MSRRDPEIDRKALFKKLEYTPHSDLQWQVHNSTARFRVAACGRRWGKSTAFGHEITLRMFVPDSMNWICGPSYKLGEKEFRIVYFDFQKLGLLKRCKKSYNVPQGQMRIYWPEMNSTVEVVSADKPDGLVGEALDYVCMSEAAKHKMSTWQMYIQPGLSDKRGCADFPSTPQGYNWFQGLYELGNSKVKAALDYESFHAPTWTNLASFPNGMEEEELINIKSLTSEMYWRQEYAAEFTAFEGMIYPEFDEKIHVREFDYNPILQNWLGVDFGFVDPFIALDCMIDSEQRVWVWREYVKSGLTNSQHATYLMTRDNPPGYHIDAIAADPRGADGGAQLNMVLGGVLQNAADWFTGVQWVKAGMKVREDGLPGLIIHPRCTELIRQTKKLRAKEIKEGQNEKIGQHDYDDHCPDALRYFFTEYFEFGGNGDLADVYAAAYGNGSEAASFFKYESGITLQNSKW